MKSKLIILLSCFIALNAVAQVGINTTTPNATLDVNGNMMVRTVPIANTSAAYDFMVVDPTTHEVQKISGNLSAPNVNTTMAKAEERSAISLINSSFYAGWKKIDFTSGTDINPGGNFDSATDFYTVPSSGVYAINYTFRYGEGVIVELFTFNGSPKIGILRHDVSGYTVLDEKDFSGVGISVVGKLIISDSSLNSIYRLTAGERLSFEVNNGGLAVGLLSTSRASFSIYKISD